MTEYLHWSEAGGPNECEHGYAQGIPCPRCDANPRIIELRARLDEIEAAWAKASARAKEISAENERLRADGEEGAREILRQNAEIERLEAGRETAKAAIAGSEKEINRLQADNKQLREDLIALLRQYGPQP